MMDNIVQLLNIVVEEEMCNDDDGFVQTWLNHYITALIVCALHNWGYQDIFVQKKLYLYTDYNKTGGHVFPYPWFCHL